MNFPADFTPAMIARIEKIEATSAGRVELAAWHAAGGYVLAAVRFQYVSERAGFGVVLVDAAGGTYRAPKDHDSMALAKMIAGYLDDDAMRPRLLGVIGARPMADLAVLPAPAAVEVGALVWTQGMGRLRRGVVTKVGPKRVEVAYTTASSAGRIYRNSLTLAQLRVDSERALMPKPLPAVEVVEAPHYCEPCRRAGSTVEAVTLVELPGQVDRWEAVCEAHRDVEVVDRVELTTVRCLDAFDAAQTVLCTIADLDVALGTLGKHVEADDRLRASILDLLAAMHSVHATLGTDASIYARHAGIEL